MSLSPSPSEEPASRAERGAPLWEPDWSPPWALAVLALPIALVLPVELGSESVTFQAYYPSPLAIYANVTTTADTSLARDGGLVAISAGVAGGTLTVNGSQTNTGYISAPGNLISNAAVSAGTVISVGSTSMQSSFLSTPGYLYAGGGTLYTGGYALYTPGYLYAKDVWLAQAGRWASVTTPPAQGTMWGYSTAAYTCPAGYTLHQMSSYFSCFKN